MHVINLKKMSDRDFFFYRMPIYLILELVLFFARIIVQILVFPLNDLVLRVACFIDYPYSIVFSKVEIIFNLSLFLQ